MAGSFILIWVWFLARQSAQRTDSALWPGWAVLLWISVALLAIIMVRRILRVRRALRGEDENVHPVTNLFPPVNDRAKRRDG
jgi:hypothetical protein